MKCLLSSKSLVHMAYDGMYDPSVFGTIWKILGNDKNIQMGSVDYEYLLNPKVSDKKNGFLHNWCKNNFAKSQINPNDEISSKYGYLINRITKKSNTRWSPIGKSYWTNPYAPEPWSIATAMANNEKIMTLHDNSDIKPLKSYASSNQAPNINIVSKLFGVQTISISELLKGLGIRF